MKVRTRNRDLVFKRAVQKLEAEIPLSKGELDEVERRETAKSGAITDSFDSMKSMAGALGIPLSILQLSKQKGCPAFRGSRVYWKDWIKWYFNGNDAVVVDWDAKQKELDYRDRLVDHEEKIGKLAPVEEVLKMIRDVMIPIRQAWLSLPATMANRVNPVDPKHAQTALDEWAENNMRLLADSERAKLKGRKND